MSDVLLLSEHEDWRGYLSSDEAGYIARNLDGQFAIRKEVIGEGFVLNPRQFVGVVELPSGLRIEIQPKVPVSSLFQMLALAYRIPVTWQPGVTYLAEFEDLIHLVVHYFVDLVEERIRQGLYRSYAEVEENLTMLRGRILFAEDVRHNFALRHRTYCQFSEFTWDVPENQVIRQVVRLLGGYQLPTGLLSRLVDLDIMLSEIPPAAMTSEMVDQFSYSRFNADYEVIHQLCRLFLDGASLSDAAGSTEMRAFLVDMNRLFEDFVTTSLAMQLPVGFAVLPQRKMFLGQGRRVPMRPDIVITFNGQPVAAADCKYKLTDVDQFDNQDYYQILAYCTALGVNTGILIVPSHERSAEDQVAIRMSDIVIARRSVDLEKIRQGVASPLQRVVKIVLGAIDMNGETSQCSG